MARCSGIALDRRVSYTPLLCCQARLSLISERYFESAPTDGLIDISLSLSTISSWRLPVADVVERLEAQARQQRRVADDDRDPLQAVADVARGGEALGDRQARCPRARRRTRRAPTRCGAGSRRRRRSGAGCGTGRAGPVSSLWAYAWWPVSHTIRSRGDSSSRWSASVISTTPSDEPRWPPVAATVRMIVSRSSSASCVELARRTGHGGRRAPGGGRGSARAGAPGSAGVRWDGRAGGVMRSLRWW